MGYITTHFVGKEYSIPADVINYVDLVDFTNEIRDNLVSSFNRQIALNIVTIENDDFMLAVINEQVSKFIHRY